MNPYIEKLKDYLAQYPRYREDIGSVTELLCRYYTEENPIENAVIRSEFYDMGRILKKLSLQDNDELFTMVMRLCMDYSSRAFQAGLCTGLQLFTELYESDPAGAAQ